MLTSFHTVVSSGHTSLDVDLYELRVGKLVLDHLLSELRTRGDLEMVKRYRFKKVNDLPVEGEHEVNQLVVQAMSQVFLQCSEATIDQVIVPTLLSIDQ